MIALRRLLPSIFAALHLNSYCCLVAVASARGTDKYCGIILKR